VSNAPEIVEDKFFALFRSNRCPELLRLYRPESAQHLVQFYDDDSSIIENVSFIAAKSFAAGDSSVLVATDSHLEQIRQRLASTDLNLDALREAGRYVAVDANEALSQLMVGSRPNETRFDNFIGGIIHNAVKSSANSFIFAFGEMVALLCAANNPNAAVRLEQLWNGLAQRYRFSLYCAYSLNSLGSEPNVDALMKICAEHALTIPSETSL